jgi:nitronate monooxygenase/enoyl-[acyl-carrier protein] reductase II
LTHHFYAINHTLSPVLPNSDAFDLTLKAKPRLISFALGNPNEYVKRVHNEGILVMHQVTTVQQAYQAAECGVDIIIAQGSEAGGFGGTIAGLVLIPQVVDAVSPIPVVAAGGVADGRGLAAVLVLGAQGVNVGTRFLASMEAPISMDWKQAILAAESQDALKVELWNDIFPVSGQAYQTIPRTLTSPFIQEWQKRRDIAKQEATQLQSEVTSAIEHGRFGELFPFTGQTTGQIKEILPVAEIVHRMVIEAEAVLKQVSHLTKSLSASENQ